MTQQREDVGRPRCHRLFYALIGLTFLLVTACSTSGGGGGGNDDGDSTGTTAKSLEPKASFSDDDIRHFLQRTHFGIEPGKVEEVQSQGLETYIDEMMDFPPAYSQPFESDAALTLEDEDDPLGLEGMFPSRSDIVEWNVELMMQNPNAFQEFMAMFWQDHFGVDANILDSDERYLMVDYINMLREKGVGSFRDLFLEASRHGAMLVFLDGADNNKFAPNENYAREFWELFSLGVDNGYTQDDILEGSQAFTGYRREFDPDTGLTSLVFDAENNKAIGKKFPLGILIEHDLTQDDYANMVDLTLAYTDADGNYLAAEYLCTKLLRYFAFENPSEDIIKALAKTLRENDYAIAPVLKELFLSEAFYSDEARKGLVRNFFETVVGVVRTTGMTESAGTYRTYLSNMQSVPSQPPSVEGWPEGDDKLNAQATGIEIPNFINELITNRSQQANAGYDISVALQPAGATSADEVVDHVAQLLGVTLDSTERAMIIDFMNVQVNNNGDETPLNYTPANPDHQNRKLRNLLWILSQHPSFHMK